VYSLIAANGKKSSHQIKVLRKNK